jgi:hypothetical protein
MPAIFHFLHQIGMYVFRFFKFDRWIYVLIDNKLPVDKNGELIFSHSVGDENEDEYLVSLVEKAYSKLYGCFHALNHGTASEALFDLTGIPP